jgi:hypothetical protein
MLSGFEGGGPTAPTYTPALFSLSVSTFLHRMLPALQVTLAERNKARQSVLDQRNQPKPQIVHVMANGGASSSAQ